MIDKILSIYFIATIACIIIPFIMLPIGLIFGELNIKEIIKDILPTLYKYTFYIWLYVCIFLFPICSLIAYIAKIVFS